MSELTKLPTFERLKATRKSSEGLDPPWLARKASHVKVCWSNIFKAAVAKVAVQHLHHNEWMQTQTPFFGPRHDVHSPQQPSHCMYNVLHTWPNLPTQKIYKQCINIIGTWGAELNREIVLRRVCLRLASSITGISILKLPLPHQLSLNSKTLETKLTLSYSLIQTKFGAHYRKLSDRSLTREMITKPIKTPLESNLLAMSVDIPPRYRTQTQNAAPLQGSNQGRPNKLKPAMSGIKLLISVCLATTDSNKGYLLVHRTVQGKSKEKCICWAMAQLSKTLIPTDWSPASIWARWISILDCCA